MVSSGAKARAHRRIAGICATATDGNSLRLLVLDELRAAIAFDAHVWLLTDPRTAVGCAPLADVPALPQLPTLIKLKYLTEVNRWTSLALDTVPVRRLHHETHGDLARSTVWRDVMSSHDVTDVASAVFADRFGCWGFLDLWRVKPSLPYDESDQGFLAEVAPLVTASLRRCQSGTFVEAAASHRGETGPVVLLLDDDLHVMSQTAASNDWLHVLIPAAAGEPPVPASVYNVAAQLLARENGVDSNLALARVHLADGFWVTLRAARLASTGSLDISRIAVTLEESSPADRLDVFARAFGLSSREGELLTLLAAGCATREIAQRMFVSELTVQDHVKAIFAKTSAHQRSSLLARALGARPVGHASVRLCP